MPSPATASSQIDDYIRGFREVKADAKQLVDETDDRVLRQQPASGEWSAVQCLDHLNTAGWLLLTRMERQINDAQENGPFGGEPFQYGFISRTFVRLMDPESSVSIPAPPSYEPADHSLEPHAVATEFIQLQDDFIRCVESSRGLDLRRVRVPSPALPIVSISLGAWYEATIAHENRHLTQARNAISRIEN